MLRSNLIFYFSSIVFYHAPNLGHYSLKNLFKLSLITYYSNLVHLLLQEKQADFQASNN